MNAPTSQPSNVSTEEEVRPADEHVVTDDRDFFNVPSPEDSKAKPAASEAKPADQTTETPAASDDKPIDASKQGGRDRPAERKIKRLQKQLAAEREARQSDQARMDTLASEIEKLKGATAAAAPEPQFKDFASPQEYAKAFQKWEAAQTPGAIDSGKPAPAARDTTKHAQDERKPAPEDPEIIDFRKKGAEKLGDEFVEAINLQGTAVDQDMGDFMLDSEYGPEIYVHLANNQEEAAKIFDSSTRRKIAALEALEVKAKAGELDAGGDGELKVDTTTIDDKSAANSKAAAAAAKTASATKAKEPPSDTRDAGAGSAAAPDPQNEDMDTYAARRTRETLAAAGKITS